MSTTVSKKFKKVLVLVALSCLSLALLENFAMSTNDRRHLKCMNKRGGSNDGLLSPTPVIYTGGDEARSQQMADTKAKLKACPKVRKLLQKRSSTA